MPIWPINDVNVTEYCEATLVVLHFFAGALHGKVEKAVLSGFTTTAY